MKIRLLLVCAFLTAPLFADPTSFYSSTERKFVAVLEDSELDEDAEIDHFTHLCPGYGGYELLHEGGDARSWVNVRFQGKKSDLYSATMEAAAGMFPFKENDVVEWRGILKDEVFTPFAIIYRVRAGDPEEEGKSFSRLLVIALNEGEAKILGAVTGADADARAKKLADTVAP